MSKMPQTKIVKETTHCPSCSTPLLAIEQGRLKRLGHIECQECHNVISK